VDNVLLFSSFEYQGGASRICGAENNGFVYFMDSSGDLVIRPLQSNGSKAFVKATVAATAGQRVALLAGIEHLTGLRIVYAKLDDGPWFEAMNQSASFDGTHFDLSSSPCYFFRFGAFVHYRTALFLPPVLPDLSSAGVQNMFVDATGKVLDPEISHGGISLPQVDINGDAATLQSGLHTGTLPSFDIITGSFIDV
jgi:hypothetical protein